MIYQNRDTMTQYQEILTNLKNGVCNYGNDVTGVYFSLGATKMKLCPNGEIYFFDSLESMARAINKFIKTGY